MCFAIISNIIIPTMTHGTNTFTNEYDNITIIIAFLVPLLRIWVIYIVKFILYIEERYIWKIFKELSLCENEINKRQELSVDIILDHISVIQKYTTIFYYHWRILRILWKDMIVTYNSVILLVNNKTLPMLGKLKILLIKNIQNSHSRLIEAKESVQENLSGKSSDLSSVSEAQIARLDRQIEQFEELQKRLVRV